MQATEKQIAFIHKLLGERELSEEQSKWLAENPITEIESKTASQIIDGLLKNPKLPGAVQDYADPAPGVPAGRYAIEQDGTTKFFQVDKPTKGKWAGRTFLSALASEQRYPIKNPAQRSAIFAAIGQDPKAASFLYGQKIGHCGVCGLTLTDESSRAAGIGPVCAQKLGWN
jgi:hypothetical protein